MIYNIVVKDASGGVSKVISFDSITRVSKGMSASVTSNTVESGYEISDSITLAKPKFDISAIITAYNIYDDDYELIWDGTAFVSTSNQTDEEKQITVQRDIEDLMTERTVFTLLQSYEESYVRSSYDEQYLELKKSVVREYNNCVLTSVVFDEQAGVSGAVFPNMTIEQISVAYVRVDDCGGR